jgi:hypothetical protein
VTLSAMMDVQRSLVLDVGASSQHAVRSPIPGCGARARTTDYPTTGARCALWCMCWRCRSWQYGSTATGMAAQVLLYCCFALTLRFRLL